VVEDDVADTLLPLPPLTPVERRGFDYSDLEQCVVQLELVLRQTRRSLDALARGTPAGAESIPALGDGEAADAALVPVIDIGDERDHQGWAPVPARG